MFNRLFTSLSTARRVAKLREEVDALLDYMFATQKHLARLDQATEEQAERLHKLRGKLYGEGLHKPPAPTVPATREERRIAALRGNFTPGRPVNHGED
jgi:hypothetical protein